MQEFDILSIPQRRTVPEDFKGSYHGRRYPEEEQIGSGLDLQACWADGHVREMMGLKESISLNYRVHLFRTGRST